MAGESEGGFVVPIVILTIITFSATVYIISWLTKRSKDNNVKSKESIKVQQKDTHSHHTKGGKITKPTKKKILKGGSASHRNFEHPHMIATLKGHTSQITSGDFSSNGKQFVTASEDRTFLIWNTGEFPNRDRKSIRGNVEYDYAKHICWSPDSKAVLIHKAHENRIEVYKLIKKESGPIKDIKKAITFPEDNRDAVIISLAVPVSGKFIMTCDEKTRVTLWDLKGGIMEQFDTGHGDTYSAVISPCGRFIATTGFTPDAKVWEVKFSKSGAFEAVKRVFVLTGHSAGIYNCSINCDTSKMATVSKDGTWRLYNTQVEYEKGQDPYLLLSGKYTSSNRPAFISLSPDGKTFTIASGSDLTFYSAVTGESLYTINDIYIDSIRNVIFEPGSKYLITLGDRHARVFHNVGGYITTIQDLEKSKSTANTSAMKERIEAQIAEAQAFLDRFSY